MIKYSSSKPIYYQFINDKILQHTQTFLKCLLIYIYITLIQQNGNRKCLNNGFISC